MVGVFDCSVSYCCRQAIRLAVGCQCEGGDGSHFHRCDHSLLKRGCHADALCFHRSWSVYVFVYRTWIICWEGLLIFQPSIDGRLGEKLPWNDVPALQWMSCHCAFCLWCRNFGGSLLSSGIPLPFEGRVIDFSSPTSSFSEVPSGDGENLGSASELWAIL